MSTSAFSANQWLNSTSPSIEKATDVLEKLALRIESWQGDDETIQGSIEAADVIQTYIDNLSVPSGDMDIKLDNSSLIPEGTPAAIDEASKLEKFAALKAKLGKGL